MGLGVLRVPQREESPLEGFLLWEQELVGRWQANRLEEEERKRVETQAPLVLLAVERWRAQQDSGPRVSVHLMGQVLQQAPLRERGRSVEGVLLSGEGR